jgi:hypothetical protein
VTDIRCAVVVAVVTVAVGCRPAGGDPARDRALALTAAQDTARHQWQHEVGVDSVQTRGDTTVVWVSPRNWMATDAPQAGVGVIPPGRIVAIRWIMGG